MVTNLGRHGRESHPAEHFGCAVAKERLNDLFGLLLGKMPEDVNLP